MKTIPTKGGSLDEVSPDKMSRHPSTYTRPSARTYGRRMIHVTFSAQRPSERAYDAAYDRIIDYIT